MKGDPVPDQDHICRYCLAFRCTENGQVTGTAFRPRQVDEYLSVNWLEFFHLADQQDEIREVRKVLSLKLTLGGCMKKSKKKNHANHSKIDKQSPEQILTRIYESRMKELNKNISLRFQFIMANF